MGFFLVVVVVAAAVGPSTAMLSVSLGGRFIVAEEERERESAARIVSRRWSGCIQLVVCGAAVLL